MVDRVSELSADRAIVEANGTMTQQTRTFFKLLRERALIIGSGTPSGIVEAIQGAQYMDEVGAIGNVFYIKQKNDVGGDTTLGWVLIG